MNLGSLGSLFIDMAADTAKFETDMGRAARLADRRAKEIQSSVKAGIDQSVRKLASLAAAYVTLDQTVGRLKRTFDQGDALDEMAQKLGANVSALSRINYAAAHEGVEDITGSMVKLSKAISESQDKNSAAAKAFKALGVNALDAAGNTRTADDVFADIVKRFGETEDGIGKTNIALALFGKSGADLIPLLNLGAAGFGRLAAQSDAFGATWTPESAAAAGQFKDNLHEMTMAVDGLFIKLAQQLGPRLSEFTAKIADPQFQQAVGRWTDKVVELAETLARNAPKILEVLLALKGATIGASLGSAFGPIGTLVGLLAGAGIGGSVGEAINSQFEDLGKNFQTAGEKAAELRTQLNTLAGAYAVLDQRIKSGESFKSGGGAAVAADAVQAEGILKRMREISAQLGAPQSGPKLSPRDGTQIKFGEPDGPMGLDDKDREKIYAEGLAHLREQMEAEGALLEERKAQWLKAEFDITQGIVTEEEQRKQYAEAAVQVQRDIEQERFNVAQQGLDLLNSIQTKNKTFQTALLLAQSALAAGSIAVSTQMAAMTAAAALALNPPAAAAAYASFQTLGAISLGIVAARTAIGIAQIQARRYGGPVAAGGMYEVAEPGNPELLRYGSKTMLMMGSQSGVVEPATRGSSVGSARSAPRQIYLNIQNAPPGYRPVVSGDVVTIDMLQPWSASTANRAVAIVGAQAATNSGAVGSGIRAGYNTTPRAVPANSIKRRG